MKQETAIHENSKSSAIPSPVRLPLPTFSLICPTFNRANLIGRAICSALSQTYTNFELILVNDGSTDKTREIVSTFDDARIVIVDHATNQGMNAALNSGFSMARGRFIAKLDDDDELTKDALRIALEGFERTHAALLYYLAVDRETNRHSGKFFGHESDISFKDLLDRKLFGDYWVLVDRLALPVGQLLDAESWGAMGSLWLRIAREHRVHYFPTVLYLAYRTHGLNRLSKAPRWNVLEHTTSRLLEEFGDDMVPSTRARNLTVLAFYQIMQGHFEEARLNLRTALLLRISVYAVGLLFLARLQSQALVRLAYDAVTRYLTF